MNSRARRKQRRAHPRQSLWDAPSNTSTPIDDLRSMMHRISQRPTRPPSPPILSEWQWADWRDNHIGEGHEVYQLDHGGFFRCKCGGEGRLGDPEKRPLRYWAKLLWGEGMANDG